MEQLHPYYEQKEIRNEGLVKCWCWAVVMIIGLTVWCFAIAGVYCWYQGH